MNNRKTNRAKVWSLWNKGISKSEAVATSGLSDNYINKLYCEFDYHKLINNGHVRYKNDATINKQKDMFFSLTTSNPNILMAYAKMLNNHNSDNYYNSII